MPSATCPLTALKEIIRSRLWVRRATYDDSSAIGVELSECNLAWARTEDRFGFAIERLDQRARPSYSVRDSPAPYVSMVT